MKQISIIIMTKNEAEDIAACIESALWANEIIILDCGSTDNTIEICKKYPVKIINTDWPGFGEQSNRGLNACNSDWCFLLDADERFSSELKEEIITTIKTTDYVAYKIPRLSYFMQRAMKHSFNPKDDQPLKLIKKGYGHFENPVHPHAVIAGKTGILHHVLLHHPFKNLQEIMEKANQYSTLGSNNLLGKKVKPSISKTFGHALWAFIKFYFLKLGLLDGWPGFIIAFSNFEGTFYRYAKLLELKNKNKID